MNIIKVKNYDELSKMSASLIAAQIKNKKDSILGLATGSSPVGTYKELIDLYEKGDLDFSNIRTVNLDEYKGISRNNEQSYYYFMNDKLFSHINIDKTNTHIPDGTKENALKECEAYEKLIEDLGGIDLQLLGLGHNGHIGFNEPSDTFPKVTHNVALTKSTIEANARFFANMDEVPKEAYTMGIGSIFKAKKIVVIVSGKDKAKIVKEAFYGEITPKVPASILQLHPDVNVIVDEEAAGLL